MWSLEYAQVPAERKLKRSPEVKSQEKFDGKSLDKAEEEHESNKLDGKKVCKQMPNISSPHESGKSKLLEFHRFKKSLKVFSAHLRYPEICFRK